MSTKSKAAAAEEKKPITLSSEHVPLSYRIKKRSAAQRHDICDAYSGAGLLCHL